MNSATTIVTVVEGYALLGVGLAVAFLGFGIERVAPGARGSYVFRVLLIPGVVLLWPLVAMRWWVLSRPPRPGAWQAHHRPWRRAPAIAATVLAVVLPALLLLGFLARQNGPLEQPAVRLAPPVAAAAQ